MNRQKSIAFLILAHQDPVHVGRLAKTLSGIGDIYIHIDLKSDMRGFVKETKGIDNLIILSNRHRVYWGSISAVRATLELINISYESKNNYDRFVLLQGADYPIKSPHYIKNFFNNNDTEYIRACNASKSKSKYLYSRAIYSLRMEDPRFFDKIFNKLTYFFDIKSKDPGFICNNKFYDIYWGCAQWALTRVAIAEIINVSQSNEAMNFFSTNFPADETFFHTCIFNSSRAINTSFGGVEPDVANLVDLKNLTYFEYPKFVKVFSMMDLNLLLSREELFARKFNTLESVEILNYFDRSFESAGIGETY